MKEYPRPITWEDVKRFIPSDNRFIIHILKRSGFSYYPDNLIEACRYYLILACGKYINNETYFESEAHVVNILSKTIFNGARAEIKKSKAAMRSCESLVEIDKPKLNPITSDTHSSEYILYNADHFQSEDGMDEHDVNVFIQAVREEWNEEYAYIIRERMKDVMVKDIAKELGLSRNTIDNRLSKIKNFYESECKRLFGRKESYRVLEDIRRKEWEELEREKQKTRNSLSEVRGYILSVGDADS